MEESALGLSKAYVLLNAPFGMKHARKITLQERKDRMSLDQEIYHFVIKTP